MIIWGSRGREVVRSKGKFYCPSCKATRKYKLMRRARYFTLYFVPLFQTKNYGEWVECESCYHSFDPEVLEAPPPAPQPEEDGGKDKDDNNVSFEPSQENLINSGLSQASSESDWVCQKPAPAPSHRPSPEVQRLAEGGFRSVDSEDYEEAIKQFEQAIEIEPNNAHLRFFVGFAQYENGNIQDAISSFNVGLRLDPSDADGCRTIATFFSSSGDSWKEAMCLRAYLDLAEEAADFDSVNARLNELGPEHRLVNVSQWLRHVEEEHTHTIWNCGELGNSFADTLKSAHPEHSSDQLNVAMREYLMNSLNQRSAEWAFEHFRNASALLDEGKYRAAILQYILGLETFPSEQRAIIGLANAYAQARDLDQAEAFLKLVDVLKEPPDRRSILLSQVLSLREILSSEKGGGRPRDPSSELGIQFLLPSGWVKANFQTGNDPELATCTVSYTGPTSMHAPTFYISVAESSDKYSQKQMIEMGRQLANNAHAYRIANLDITIDGCVAGGVLYKSRDYDIDIVRITVCAATGRRFYMLGWGAECKYETELKQVYMSIMSSIRFVDQ